MFEPTVIRLFVSQAFLSYYLLILLPVKKPIKRNTLIIIAGVLFITFANAFIIVHLGMSAFYVRFFFITLLLPNIILYSFFVVHKGAKLLFAMLSVQVFGNVAIINGVFVSFLINGADNPLEDTLTRIFTYVVFLPVIYKFVRPQYLKMAHTLNKGWAVLNFVLILSYILTYYIGFVPTPVLFRPEYFPHAYIGLVLSLLIYIIIFFLFAEIQSKVSAERDKQLLAIQVGYFESQSAAISASEEKINILKHDMRHHIMILSEQIKSGDLKEAALLLHGLEKELVEPKFIMYCKNKVINAALTHYLAYASKNNIEVDAKLDIPETISINPSELAIVIANAVENAIHACLKIEDVSARKITLDSRYTKGSLFLRISNPCFEEVTFGKHGLPIAHEADHGTGVISMKAFAKKHKAILDFSLEDNVFYFLLLINSL